MYKHPTNQVSVPAAPHNLIDGEADVPGRLGSGGVLSSAKEDIRRLNNHDGGTYFFFYEVCSVLVTIDIVPGLYDVAILCTLLEATTGILTALDDGAGDGGFGEGLGLSGDGGGFGRRGFEELIVGGGRIGGEHSVSWIGDSKREVGDLNEDEKESAVAQHRDSRLVACGDLGSVGW